MGTVHSLVEARRKRFNLDHETKLLAETAGIVRTYYERYTDTVKDLGDLTAQLERRKEQLKGVQGWFRRAYLKPTTNELQHAVDTCRLRLKLRHRAYMEAKELFDQEKDKVRRRLGINQGVEDFYHTIFVKMPADEI